MSSEHGEPGTSPEKRKSRKALYGAIAGVAGVAVVAASIIGFEEGANQPDKRPIATASSDPSKTPEATSSPKPEALTVQSVEIPAGLSPEQLGITLVSRLSDWDMAGATPDNRDAYFAEGAKTGNADAYATKVADSNGGIYAEALFGPDWQSVSGLATYVPNKEIANADIIALWFKTSAGTSGLDKVPFRNWDTVNSVTVVSQDATSVSERISVTSNNNAGQGNRAETLAPGTAAQNGDKFDVLATFTTANGVEKVSSFDIETPQS